MRTFTKVILSVLLVTMPFVGIVVKAQEDPTEPKSGWVDKNLLFSDERGVLKINVVNQDTLWVITFDPATNEPTLDFAISLDAGDNWTLGQINITTGYLPYDIHAISADTAWIVAVDNTNAAGVFKTEDAGATWVQQTTAVFNTVTGIPVAIRMLDENTGFCITENISIFKTTDGGDNWVALETENTGEEKDIVFPQLIDGEKVLALKPVVDIVEDNLMIGTTAGRMLVTGDSGNTWTIGNIYEQVADKGSVISLSFSSKSIGTAILKNDGGSIMYRTANAGSKWNKVSQSIAINLNQVVSVPSGSAAFYIGVKASNEQDADNYSIVSTNATAGNWRTIDTGIAYTYVAMFDADMGWIGTVGDNTTTCLYRWAEVPYFVTSVMTKDMLDNEELLFTIEAKDDNNLPLTFSASIPNWMTLENNNDGTVTLKGTPTKLSDGVTVSTNSYRIDVTNGARSVSTNFILTLRTSNVETEFKSTPILESMVYKQYLYEIVVEDEDAQDILKFEASMPNWLTLVNQESKIIKKVDGVTDSIVRSSIILTGVPENVGNASITIVVKDGFHAKTQSFSITILPYDNVEDLGYGKVVVYPNPSTNFINVKNCPGVKYEMFDIVGKKLKEGFVKEYNERIDISDLSNGNILIKLQNEDKVYTTKLIKQ
jgi:hypothetical protein